MPVPRDRSDDAYFAPLTRLKLKPGTQLCLGLVHYTDGDRGHAPPPRHGGKICEELLDRDRMRVRPPAPGYYI